MDSLSRSSVLELFDEIIEWKRRSKNDCFNWTPEHLSAVRRYASKSSLNSDSTQLAAAEFLSDTEDTAMLACFTQHLQKFFMVQRLIDEHSSTLIRRNELIAAFIDFLLQLLHHETPVFLLAFEDRIRSLDKELRFLVAVLGDTIMLYCECGAHEQLLPQGLAAEFEAVADEAGKLVHSLFFSVDPFVFEPTCEMFDALLENIGLLKFSITISSVLLPPAFIETETNAAPKKTAATTVDSIFIVDSLVRDLDNILNQDRSLIVDVKGQIKTLKQELILSSSLLKDIKVPPYSEIEGSIEADVRARDVAYEAEFLITSFLVGDAPLWYICIRLPHVIHMIKLIGTALQEIKNDYHDTGEAFAKSFGARVSLEGKRSSDFDDVAVGFDDNATDILDQLVGGRKQLQIISIHGMPGVGKTTFAHKLYNHPLVCHSFSTCSWSVVSQTYHRRSLLIDILIGLSIELDQNRILNMDEESLVERIYKNLKGRRYLVVMDDIWDSNLWYDVRRCFPDDANGSRILFTTRNRDLAPPNSLIHQLPFLSEKQCWELLEKKVFHNKPCPQHLVGIGKEIAANCCGLPLAVVVIAGILSTMDKEENAWKQVGENVASYISSSGNGFTMQVLEFSYKHLPEHLKPCFLYFGVFPEDKEIQSRKLMRLWIAEGFIRKDEKNNNAEDAAEEYLMELIDRSLVIVSEKRSYGGVKSCVVHDLLRELCLKKAEEENFLRLVVDDHYSVYEKGQRVVSLGSSIVPFGQHLRSFHGNLPESPIYVANMALLRVLGFNKLINPGRDLIGMEFLVQLRYLEITDLPESIGSLVNLECLIVITSQEIVIHSVVLKMTRLRYLHLTDQASYAEDCDISRSNNIQSLGRVMVTHLEDEEMLKCSPHLRKLRCVCRPLLYAEEDKISYRYPNLLFFSQLESLHMSGFYDYGPRVAKISFPATIRKLTITRLCLPWKMMSAIGGLPNLVVLKLRCDAFVGAKWKTKDGEFPQLRFLKMYKLDLRKWNVESSEHFPRLQRLVLFDCYNLEEVPSETGDIGTLQFIELRGWCLKTLVDSAVKIEEEQHEMGNEELRVLFA
ncbi:hypothetical protein ABFS82_08G084000 [Erythranthe guttata]|uniref:putative late blight resistance protein homolog R1A-3 n=1 Tax=Erythranthe guttata TaxID=4155 RepID=UPI00064DAABA|nr:PREDICTED: putative late blight resistance protein homolog R1A-3 [Erythranthe guttata]|eukprot:XP_012857645.1 PREDICTED: putative late blight resistance protein homolog R1A-3 [Erythranthe guttata]